GSAGACRSVFFHRGEAPMLAGRAFASERTRLSLPVGNFFRFRREGGREAETFFRPASPWAFQPVFFHRFQGCSARAWPRTPAGCNRALRATLTGVQTARRIQVTYDVAPEHDRWLLEQEDVPESPLHDAIIRVLVDVLLAWDRQRGSAALIGSNVALRWNQLK